MLNYVLKSALEYKNNFNETIIVLFLHKHIVRKALKINKCLCKQST